jgi:hypothetical protein
MHVASNPANVKVEVMHFLKSDLKDLSILVVAILLFAGIVLFSWKLAVIILGLTMMVFVMSIIQAKNVFEHGDVCPAMVIDAERKLVAVFADLSKTGKPHYVIKVLKQPLGRVPGGPFPEGTRLAFLAMYNGFPKETVWRGFGGYLVNTGTAKKKTIERVLKSIPEGDWNRLEKTVPLLDDPPKPGQYVV